MSNLLYPFILGIVTKVYDDIIDINLNVSTDIITILQSLIILFFTLTSYGDFYFSFACLVVSYLNPGFDNPFWKSIRYVAFILTIINLPNAGNNIILKTILSVLAIIGILLLAVFEDKLFPEEVSIEKIVFRFLLIFGFGIATIFLQMGILPIPRFAVEPLSKTTTIMCTNMIVSVSIMYYLLFYSNKSLKELNGL
jgi:multidrug transporter EmrE-like cation transporter